jgi:hypothetical protein
MSWLSPIVALADTVFRWFRAKRARTERFSLPFPRTR